MNKKSECWACWHPLLNMSWKILKTFEVWREGHLCKLQALIGFPLVSIIVTQIQSSEFRTFSVTPGTEMSRQGGEEERSHDSYSGLGAGYGLRGQIKIRSQSSPEISRFPHTSIFIFSLKYSFSFAQIFFGWAQFYWWIDYSVLSSGSLSRNGGSPVTRRSEPWHISRNR